MGGMRLEPRNPSGPKSDITAQAPGPITPHVQGGAARLLANWGSKRAAEYPDVPTFIEIGYEEVEYYIWAGLFVPMGTSAPVIARLRDAMREVMKNPQVTDVFVKAASPPAYLDQPEPTPSVLSLSSEKSADWTRNED